MVTRSRVWVQSHLALIGYLILAGGLIYAITLNRLDIDKVCWTVQRQLDRNAASVGRSLEGLQLIERNPLRAVRLNVPGAGYYAERPAELARAIDRSERELATYQVTAC